MIINAPAGEINATTINAPTGRTATYVVCASDSVNKAQCDYVCDGVADDVEIQAAIDAAGLRGVVLLSEGHYVINHSLTLDSGVSLRGASRWNTIINCSPDMSDAPWSAPIIYAYQETGMEISHLMLDSNYLNLNLSDHHGSKRTIWLEKSSNISLHDLTIYRGYGPTIALVRSSMVDAYNILIADSNYSSFLIYGGDDVPSHTITLNSIIVKLDDPGGYVTLQPTLSIDGASFNDTYDIIVTDFTSDYGNLLVRKARNVQINNYLSVNNMGDHTITNSADVRVNGFSAVGKIKDCGLSVTYSSDIHLNGIDIHASEYGPSPPGGACGISIDHDNRNIFLNGIKVIMPSDGENALRILDGSTAVISNGLLNGSISYDLRVDATSYAAISGLVYSNSSISDETHLFDQRHLYTSLPNMTYELLADAGSNQPIIYVNATAHYLICLLYTSPSPRD